jgi:hypothetical protein
VVLSSDGTFTTPAYFTTSYNPNIWWMEVYRGMGGRCITRTPEKARYFDRWVAAGPLSRWSEGPALVFRRAEKFSENFASPRRNPGKAGEY